MFWNKWKEAPQDGSTIWAIHSGNGQSLGPLYFEKGVWHLSGTKQPCRTQTFGGWLPSGLDRDRWFPGYAAPLDGQYIIATGYGVTGEGRIYYDGRSWIDAPESLAFSSWGPPWAWRPLEETDLAGCLLDFGTAKNDVLEVFQKYPGWFKTNGRQRETLGSIITEIFLTMEEALPGDDHWKELARLALTVDDEAPE